MRLQAFSEQRQGPMQLRLVPLTEQHLRRMSLAWKKENDNNAIRNGVAAAAAVAAICRSIFLTSLKADWSLQTNYACILKLKCSYWTVVCPRLRLGLWVNPCEVLLGGRYFVELGDDG